MGRNIEKYERDQPGETESGIHISGIHQVTREQGQVSSGLRYPQPPVISPQAGWQPRSESNILRSFPSVTGQTGPVLKVTITIWSKLIVSVL